MRKLIWAAISLAAAGIAQPVAFEVASVKTAGDPGRPGMFCLVPCTPGERLNVDHTRVDIRYMSLEKLIVTAYGIQTYQLADPEWMREQRFDIQAKMPAGAAADRIPGMLQTLLAERFKLAIHREGREIAVLALTAGKEGLKLKEARADDGNATVPDTGVGHELYTPEGDARMLADNSFVARGGPLGPIRAGMLPARQGMKFEFLNLSMAGMAILLTGHSDRPVVDETGLKGGYRFVLENRPPLDAGGHKGEGAPEGGPRRDLFGENLLSAIEKAGLRLEKSKARVETIVVDRVEKTPTEN